MLQKNIIPCKIKLNYGSIIESRTKITKKLQKFTIIMTKNQKNNNKRHKNLKVKQNFIPKC